jgi:hypothetical protein
MSTLIVAPHGAPKLPSERSFGFLFAAVFAGIGAYGLYRGWSTMPAAACFAGSVLFALCALFSPKLLGPLNWAWFKLGQLLGMVVSPIVLAILYFALLAPVAIIARIAGRDELKLSRRHVSSYWIERKPPGPSGESLKNQF